MTRLADAVEALVRRFMPREPYLGARKYRVIRMRASPTSAELTRAELQIVTPVDGLPDLLMVPVWGGLAGSLAKLAGGALVLVQFVDGDPEQPYVAAFSSPDEPAWRPVDLTVDATGSLKLGPSAASIEAKGSDVIPTPGLEAGRFVRYGDVVMMPSGAGATPTAVVLLGSAFPATVVPVAPFPASKLRGI